MVTFYVLSVERFLESGNCPSVLNVEHGIKDISLILSIISLVQNVNDMAGKCLCPPCNGRIITRLQAKLNTYQRDMLGFFCKNCILKQCDSEHKP
jgi:hypothetical protein